MFLDVKFDFEVIFNEGIDYDYLDCCLRGYREIICEICMILNFVSSLFVVIIGSVGNVFMLGGFECMVSVVVSIGVFIGCVEVWLLEILFGVLMKLFL